jgi:hypothetical protein
VDDCRVDQLDAYNGDGEKTMARHDFAIGVMEHGGTPVNAVGAQCRFCGEIVLYVNGSIPREKLEEECEQRTRVEKT